MPKHENIKSEMRHTVRYKYEREIAEMSGICKWNAGGNINNNSI